jgi:hypothetical protein
MAKQWIKLTSYEYLNDAEFGAWYLENYQKNTFREVKDKDFELDIAINAAVIAGKQWLKDINEDEYILTAIYNFGPYDIKTESFPISADVYEDSYEKNADYFMEFLDLPDKTTLLFTIDSNLRNMRLSMPKGKAKKFINSKKDQYGKIDRSLRANLGLKVTTAGGTEYRGDKSLVLNSEVTSFELVDPKTYQLIKKFK